MVDFRKWFPALVIVALLLGSAVSASAQAFTCATATGVPPVVRGEGLAELLGDVVLNCTGGVSTPNGALVPGVNINVFLNTNITSKIVSGTDLTEALLLIDEPAAGNQVPCIPGTTPGPVTNNNSCSILGTGAAGVLNPVTGAITPGGVNYGTGGIPNVYQGKLVTQPGTNLQYLSWTGIPIDAPGTVGTRVVRITNIRGDANNVGIATSFLPNQIVATVTITSTQAISLPQPNQQIGFPIRGLGGFSVVSGVGTASPFLQCVGNAVNPNGISFRARFIEGFSSAFKPRGLPAGGSLLTAFGNGVNFPATVLTNVPNPTPPPPTLSAANPFPGYSANTAITVAPQNSPGQNTFTETGFYNPAFPATNGLNVAGLATQGTRLIIRLSNLPTGQTLYAGIYETLANTSLTSTIGLAGAASSRVVLIGGADANGAGGAPVTAGTTVGGQANLFAVSPTNGAATLVYEVMTSDPSVLETIDIPFYVTFAANAAALTPSNAIPAMTGALAPLSTIRTASATAPVPRFVDLPISNNAFVINPCRTNLLFPFVTNQFGFDTGIAIANTTKDIFGTAPQQGPCTINYFGATTGGGAAPAAQTSAAPVPSGSTLTFTLSFGSGAPYNVPGAQAFSGYIIAQCDFQYAHGFAFIQSANAVSAEGYLALVMDAPTGSRTTYASESLNQ